MTTAAPTDAAASAAASPPGAQYAAAVRNVRLICAVAATIVWVCVAVARMTVLAWVLGFVVCALGGAAYATIGTLILALVCRDRPRPRSDSVIALCTVVFFSLATVAFLAIGVQHHGVKTWVVAFVGAYGAAVIYSAIARLIVSLVRKDTRRC